MAVNGILMRENLSICVCSDFLVGVLTQQFLLKKVLSVKLYGVNPINKSFVFLKC